MDPMTMMMIFGGLKGLGDIWNTHSQLSKQHQLSGQLQGMMQPGMSDAENQLMQLLTSGKFDPSKGSGSQGFNTGQDALMQMVKADPYDTSGIFNALAPVEKRTNDTALADFRSGFNTLGERFGSASAMGESNLRAQQGEQQNLLHSQIASQAYENAANRQLQAAGQLEQGGLGQNNQMLQFMQQLMSGFGLAGNMDNSRNSNNLGVMQMLMGLGGGSQAGSALGGIGQTGGDLSQLLFMLPLLKGMLGNGTGLPKVA